MEQNTRVIVVDLELSIGSNSICKLICLVVHVIAAQSSLFRV